VFKRVGLTLQATRKSWQNSTDKRVRTLQFHLSYSLHNMTGKAVFLAALLLTTLLVSAVQCVKPPVTTTPPTPPAPPSENLPPEEFFLLESLTFCAPPSKFVSPTLRNGGKRVCAVSMSSVQNNDNPLVTAFKKAYISLEEILVGITQGPSMASAAHLLEEDRLLGSRRLARAKKSIMNRIATLKNNEEDTASMADMYGGFYSPKIKPEKHVPWEENVFESGTRLMKTAKLGDCYGPTFSEDTSQLELSGGYFEGDGEAESIVAKHHQNKESKYSASKLREKYGTKIVE